MAQTTNYNLPYPSDYTEQADVPEAIKDLAEATDGALGDKYEKPSGGIPSTDMTSAVQTSLGKADSAVQNTDYATDSSYGIVKTGYGLQLSNGNTSAQTFTYQQYSSAGNSTFIGKGTLENVLTAVVGDINSMLDEINGEII